MGLLYLNRRESERPLCSNRFCTLDAWKNVSWTICCPFAAEQPAPVACRLDPRLTRDGPGVTHPLVSCGVAFVWFQAVELAVCARCSGYERRRRGPFSNVSQRNNLSCLLKDRDPNFSCVAYSFDRFQSVDLAVCAQGSENERRRSAYTMLGPR